MNYFSYTVISNLVSLIISTLVVIIIPKLIGVKEYGYWQLYFFYTSYLGFFNVGWVEGIYLRYGGQEYNELNKDLFTSQFWLFYLYIIITGSLILIYSLFNMVDFDKQFILQMVSICLVVSIPRSFLLYVLQSTNRIGEYSKLTLYDRIIYCVVILIMLLFGNREYKQLILADLIGKTVTFFGVLYFCKEIVFAKWVPLKENFKEMLINISVGIKLLFANLASILIIGIIRFGIERSWGISVFGKVSLSLSVSNFLMLFINAIGIVLFPILKRTDVKKLSNIYEIMRTFLMVPLFGILILYYPLKITLSMWLPQYLDSLKYMALLFPMCVYEGKMALLINTYLKTLRKEKLMLIINSISLVISIIITFITTSLFNNLDWAIVSIIFVLAFKCILAELILSKIIERNVYKDIVLEVILTLTFIFIGWFLNSWVNIIIYGSTYGIYLVMKRNDITKTLHSFKVISK